VDLRQLTVFAAIEAEQHFGRAAESLRLTQAAVSQSIRSLEREWGVQLFERTTRRVRLTEAGKALLPLAREVLDSSQRLRDAAQAARAGSESELRVGFVGSAANETTPQLIRHFADEHPGVTVNLVQCDFGEPDGGLVAGRTDVAFVRLPVASRSRLRLRPLLSEGLVVVVSSNHRFSSRAEVRPEEVREERLVPAPSDDPTFRSWWLDPTGEGLPRQLAHPARGLDAWLESIAAGQGISYAPESTARYYARPGLSYVPVRTQTRSSVALACRRGDRRSLVTDFLALADVSRP
jgi:DNA-binding transcriptional LysR family regulator